MRHASPADLSPLYETEPSRDCPLCPRLVALRLECRDEHPDWWNAPVPSFGDPNAWLAIVGLAPGKHAAGLLEGLLELLLGDVAVIALQLLLGAQLQTIVAGLALAALAMLAGAIFALVVRALRAAPNILAEPAVDLMLRVDTFRHL